MGNECEITLAFFNKLDSLARNSIDTFTHSTNTETQGINGCSWRHARARPVEQAVRMSCGEMEGRESAGKEVARLKACVQGNARRSSKGCYLLLDGVRVGRPLGSIDDFIGQAPEGKGETRNVEDSAAAR